MRKDRIEQSIVLRISLVAPPLGVRFAVQKGRSELLPPTVEHADAIQFDFSLRLGPPQADGSVNFLGEFAQGPPAERFVYINSGTSAGQVGSCWTRRAKLKLASIPTDVLQAALSSTSAIVEARVSGSMADGSPICASLKPHAVVWRILQPPT